MERLYKSRPDRLLTRSFSLQIMLMLVALLCIWLGVQIKWIRDRHRAIDWCMTHDGGISLDGSATAPWSIGIFGERGYRTIHTCGYYQGKRKCPWNIRSLFPEASTAFSGPNTVVGEVEPLYDDEDGNPVHAPE